MAAAIEWFKNASDKIDDKLYNVNKKVQRVGKRIEENCSDTGELVADALVPRPAIDPKKRSNYLSQSRNITGASRTTRAANSTDREVLEKRMRAVDKINQGMGRAAGSGTVAVASVAAFQPHHAALKGTGTAVELAKTSTHMIKEQVWVNEMNRRQLSDADCRPPKNGSFSTGYRDGGLGALKKALISESVHEVGDYVKTHDTSPYSSTTPRTVVPAYNTPPMNTPVYSQTYTPFPSGIPTTPVYRNSYSTYNSSPQPENYSSGQYGWSRQ